MSAAERHAAAPEAKEIGLIFSAPMVRAILAGKKTMTRRVVDPRGAPAIDPRTSTKAPLPGSPKLRVRLQRRVTSDFPTTMTFREIVAEPGVHHARMNRHGAVCAILDDGTMLGLKPGEFDFLCPYLGTSTTSLVDDTWRLDPTQPVKLWVRETFALRSGKRGPPRVSPGVVYRADEADGVLQKKGAVWKSPRFMPRRFARLELDVIGVRLERLQRITNSDVRREGIEPIYRHGAGPAHSVDCIGPFRDGWDAINGGRAGCAWKDDPFVWVIDFRVGDGGRRS